MTRYVKHCLILLLLMASVVTAETKVSGNYENSECIECHEERNPSLIIAWRSGPHGKSAVPVDCVACHGKEHLASAAQARLDSSCSQCHGGDHGAISHSYKTSKHGVIVKLEADESDWSKALSVDNYRAPGCAFCHYSGGGHDVTKYITRGKSGAEAKEARQQMRWVCQQCHAPRYIHELESNGRKMLELGEMKLREAAEVVEMARKEFSADQLTRIDELYDAMKSKTMNALRAGISHQSPDYQWWHGQPALDGKLLRIKGELNRLRREREIQGTTDN